MPIEPVVTQLRATLATISTGTKAQFLTGFADVHSKWHMSEMTAGIGKFAGKPIGFLSFHHEVLAVYIQRYSPTLAPGTMAQPVPAFRPTIAAAPNALAFSQALEDWHNSVHRNTKKYGAQFTDPTKNILMPRFWMFHKFIDIKFTEWLTGNGTVYDDLDHTAV